MGTPKIEHLPRYTYDDYVQWEGKWELLAGIAYAMTPAPAIIHQSVSHKIDGQLYNRLKECDECQALLPVDWKIDENTVVQPDNLVVCYPPQGNYITKAPVLIFEVISKSNALKDTEIKFDLYQKEGVKYYCLISPDDRMAKVYRLEKGMFIKMGDFTGETVEFNLNTSCIIPFDFSEIWSD